MKIFILALGTRGDFEPFWALGRLLQRRGHLVTIGTSEFHFQSDANLRWVKIGGGQKSELLALLRSMADEPDLARRETTYGQQWIHPQLEFSREKFSQMAVQNDYFISNLKLPMMRRDAVLPGAFVTYDPPVDAMAAKGFGSHNHGGNTLDLVAMNRDLVDPQAQWDDHFQFTGFWALPRRRLPRPPELDKFCKSGPPVVVLTLGSMASFDSDHLSNCFKRALEISGLRGVMVAGWSDQTAGHDPSGLMITVQEIDYDWLFQRAACVLHHGGVGTVSSVLYTGVPSILLPQIPSQVRWGDILMREGLCIRTFHTHSLEPGEIALSIQSAVHDGQFRSNALRWKARLESERGITGAIDLVEAHWKKIGLTGSH